MLWEGYYQNFSTNKASASGGFASWTLTKGLHFLDPQQTFAPSNDLSWHPPWVNQLMLVFHHQKLDSWNKYLQNTETYCSQNTRAFIRKQINNHTCASPHYRCIFTLHNIHQLLSHNQHVLPTQNKFNLHIQFQQNCYQNWPSQWTRNW